jgi:phospholipase/carboxylesterase
MLPSNLYQRDIPFLAEGFYTSLLPGPRSWPVRLFLPTGYEPSYRYPLLIFLHGHGSNEEQVLRLAPRLSRRNFLSIALRGLEPLPGARRWTWGSAASVLAEEYVFQALEHVQSRYAVHPQRVYLVGCREGAALAYRLGLSFPEYFAGILSLNGLLPRHDPPRWRWPAVRRLRIFLAHGIANAILPLSLARQDRQALQTAGLAVSWHTYPTTHRLHADMLRDANRWLIAHCQEDRNAATPAPA